MREQEKRVIAKPVLKSLRKQAGVAETKPDCVCGGTLWAHACDHVTLLYGHVNQVIFRLEKL